MSGIAGAIVNGIDSATYNPEAEKARKEAKEKAEKEKELLRKLLFSLRDQVTNKQNISSYVQKKINALVDSEFQNLQKNPDQTEDEYKRKKDTVQEQQKDIFSVNDLVLILDVAAKVSRLQADKYLLEKRITDAQKTTLYTLASSIESFMNSIDTKETKDIRSFYESTRQGYKAIITDSDLALDVTKVNTLEKQVTAEKKADENTFRLSRLINETVRITMSTVGSLFLVMLFLISGMLTANDAIGRDVSYRILYFIYGGLGFPVMLIYYLYRWFFGTAPHIYRLLPIYTQESDTTIGRFFLFPFTYKEDKAAIEARTNFMTEAASLVGKEYKAPADQLSNILEGVQKIALNVGEAVSKTGTKGANQILAGLEKLQLPK
jgi:hypothetical protein